MSSPTGDRSSSGYGLSGAGALNGQSGPESSGGFDQSRERPVNGQPWSGKTGDFGQSGMGLMSSQTGDQSASGQIGDRSSDGYGQLRTGSSGGYSQTEVGSSGSHGKDIEMESGDALSQTNVLNKDLLAQEGLQGAIILNSQNLVQEREMLLRILLGSRTLPTGKDHLLEAAGSLALEGLLCKGSLGGFCGHGSLVGINDVLKSTILLLKITDFDIVQVSWKVHPFSDLQLQFQTRLTITFPRLLSFLSGSTLDVTIQAPLALPQTRSGQVSLALQNCQPVFTGIHILLSSATKVMLTQALRNSLPTMLCPVVHFWFYIINQQLSILKSKMWGRPDETLQGPPHPLLFSPLHGFQTDFSESHL
uniref:Lipid-binding serum glycoprotein N-terminal domain-containing protein n=1 Tax=Ursus americanus TaxID=9643 RepID=A0A452SDN7_URSAM